MALLAATDIPCDILHHRLTDILLCRIQENPFNLAALIIFALAIIHTLLAHNFTHLACSVERKWKQKHPENKISSNKSFVVEVLFFLGEVEIIFGLWVIPLMITMAYFWDWTTAIEYIDNNNYTEALFVICIMTIAGTLPIISCAERALYFVAKIFKGSIAAWWFTILTIGPIFGSLITEPGAMTLSALLLGRQFYHFHPGKKLAYATIGLLFVNISIGGVLTNFAAPPVLMVARTWNWSSWFMFTTFGWKSILAILLSNTLYFFTFRKELALLEKKKQESESTSSKPPEKEAIPLWITVVHILFVVALVMDEKYPAVVVGIFFLFLGFYRVTRPYQDFLNLKSPILVGTFLGALIIHGNLQGWWIEPIIQSLSIIPLIFASALLTSFNDNAMITYLSTLIPDLSYALKYAIVTGAITGGGLTVIANAPNPAGQMLLSPYFKKGVSPFYLFLGAIIPTLIMLAISLIFLDQAIGNVVGRIVVFFR